MIIKHFEIKKFLNIKNIFLIYGENEGLKDDLIAYICSNYSTESIFKYSEKEIFNNLQDFYNNIFSKSFFEKKKINFNK